MTGKKWEKEDNNNKALYTRLLNEHGADNVRALDWGSREGQALRFQVLTEIGIAKGNSVLDVGCGTGDYYGWLRDNSISANYNGVDITPAMIDACRKKYPGVSFSVEDILTGKETGAFDCTVASGVFAKRPEAGVIYLQSFVTRLYALCRKGAAFNSLSSWATDRQPGEFYADPLETLNFCRTISPWVSLRCDYHNRDFTIYLYRERRG